MADYLSLSKAAKLVGATREEIQEKVRRGLLPTFEGQVSEADLKLVYPRVRLEDNADIERLQQLQENALTKSILADLSDTRRMKLEIVRLQHDLQQAKDALQSYHRLTTELESRLIDMQEDCTHRQKLMLKALLTWFNSQVRKFRH